jgi:hypothetical protein
MAEITIPEPYEAGLKIILSLTDESVHELVSALLRIPAKVFPYSLANEITPNARSIPIDDLSKVIETLQSLYFSNLDYEAPPDLMAEDISLVAAKNEALSKEDQEKLRDRLAELLDIESLRIVTKALRILRNNQNVFHEARIITEIRPVFGSDIEEPPPAAVILHMLNITCHGIDGHKEFFIAMDTDDIEVLREVINRADAKTISLKAMLAKAGTIYLETE